VKRGGFTAEAQRGKGLAKARRRQALLFVNGKPRDEAAGEFTAEDAEDTENVDG